MPSMETIQDFIQAGVPLPIIKDNAGWHTMYAVRRDLSTHQCKLSHGSIDGDNTLCGKYMVGGAWYITHNGWDGPITCPKCLKIIRDCQKDHPELLKQEEV